MASACLREELSCSICLSLYTDPVSLRCGHNFCRVCIVSALDAQERDEVYSCPECRAEYQERPLLDKNRKLCNIVESFLSSQPEQEETKVFCTHCLESPVPAVKTCLQCEMSMCEDHLSVHNKSVDHVLIEPTSSLNKRKCRIHKKHLEYYCCEDDACICVYCVAIGSHKGHQVESFDEAMKTKQEKLRNILEKLTSSRAEAEEQVQSLQDRRREVQEEAVVATGKVTELFMDIRNKLEALERRVLSEISRQTEEISLEVSDLIQQLEAQKDELSSKMRHIEQLCKMTDPLTVLQHRDSDTYDGYCEKENDTESDPKKIYSVDDLDQCLISVTLHSGLSDLLTGVKRGFYIFEAADILLDINTTSSNVCVSGDLKSASWSTIDLNYPENTMRFTDFCQVLSSTNFNSGQHYWEVEVSTTNYWRVGVAYSSIDRKENQSKIGENSQSWCLRLFEDGYITAHNSLANKLRLESPVQVLGIYLDYEAGRLSFYQRCDPIRHLHTFTASFTEPLHAGFLVWREGWIKLRI
ncbi:E3 ubiquitin/ISG15 ligase TRIM25-like [Mixophyes fleayi]|uniref:E3 ubiquitin/ISG15 ligase TRIM25-like n=1 Tax=Mixophyes fleayi TaxID=3061075 RepID=UPI003F4E0C96